jgi:hypothetical protein
VISAIIHSALGPLVGGRVYPNTFEQPNTEPPRLPTWPAVRYQFISSDPAADICGTAGEELDDVRVQIDVVAKTFGAMKTLKEQVITAMMVVAPPAQRQPGGIETYDAETKTHRAVLEYVFYPSSAFTGSPTT